MQKQFLRQHQEKVNLSLDSPKIGGYLLSLFGLGQICSWGTLFYSFPQMATAMNAELAWTKPAIYGALTIGLLCSAGVSIPVGIAIDKGHGRLLMSLGSVLAGLLCIAWSQVYSILWFYIIFAGIGLLHATTLYEAAFAVISKYYSNTKEIKRHITTLTLWGGFASTLFIPLIEFLIQATGWRNTLMILGLINIFICATIYYKLPKHSAHETTKHVKKSSKDSMRWALLRPVFWVLLITFILYAAISSGFRFHLYPLLLHKGLGNKDVVLILALLGPAQIAGRIIIKILATKSITYIGVITIALFPLTFSAFTFLPTKLGFIIPLAIAFGAASGIMTILKGTAVLEFLTKHSYGAINGMMNIPAKIMQALAPSLAAFSWYMSKQEYDFLLIILTLTSIAMLASFVTAAWLKNQSKHTSID